MNIDPDRARRAPTHLTDDELGSMVRATAADWIMPPQRLDHTTWREIAGAAAARPGPGILTRLLRPAGTALIATVVVALVAVWLTAPPADRSGVGASPAVTEGSSPSTSNRPAPSRLPAVVLNGDLPKPSKVMVHLDGTYLLADLATGTLARRSVDPAFGPSTLVPRPGGGWLCVCSSWTGLSAGGPTGVDVEVATVAPDGRTDRTTLIRSVTGAYGSSTPASGGPGPVDVVVKPSLDDRYVFLGWSARDGDRGWTSGVDVVDVATAQVVSASKLEIAEPAGALGRPTTRTAPWVSISPASDTVVLSSFWFVDDPSPTPQSGTDAWRGSFADGEIGNLTEIRPDTGTDCPELDRGMIDSTMWWRLCLTSTGQLVIDRLALDGSRIDKTDLPRADVGPLVSRQGDGLFLWDPASATISRFDLVTAALSTSTGVASAATDVLGQVAAAGRELGRWLAPPVQAKTYLDPAIAVSNDGSRVYALGVDPSASRGTAGSRGVFVFDADSLDPIGHWASTADFVSLAVSADGDFVYAIGQPGVDADGNDSFGEASITVYDAADGSVRLLAGRLGSGALYFPDAVVR